jgi:hypothetical protein
MNMRLPFRPRIAATSIALLVCALSAGCGSTQMDHSWRSPVFQGPAFKKVLVIGLAAQPDVRQVYEDAFVEQLRAAGAGGAASYMLLSDVQTADKEAIKQAAAQSGADAVLLTRLVKVEKQGVVVRPDPGVQDRIDSAWPGTYTPVVAGETKIVTLESKLFDAESGQLVWSAATQTFDAEDLQKAISSTSRIIVKELAKQKLL